MTSATLATWLILYFSLLALCGFIGVIARGILRPGFSNRSLLRACTVAAFVLSSVLWLFVLPQG